MTMTNPQIQMYEERAAQQRREIHGSVAELKGAVRERLDVKKNLRQYMAPAAGFVAVFGTMVGYGVASLFDLKRRPRQTYGGWVELE
jgi:hypothetical protein